MTLVTIHIGGIKDVLVFLCSCCYTEKVKVDYNKLADTYDEHRTGGGPYFDTLIGLARDCSARRVLEVGPGTGNNTIAFQKAYPCDIVAVELSPGMISRAREKNVNAQLINGDASHIPLADACVDFVFGICVMHHFRDLTGLFSECLRVLDGGCAAFVTSPWDYIQNHPMNEYFPSFARVDTSRFQPVEEVIESFREAGFGKIDFKRDKAFPTPIDRAYADRVAGHYISTFDLIPDDEFEEGIKRLYEDIEAQGELQRTIAWEAVTVWGIKSLPIKE